MIEFFIMLIYFGGLFAETKARVSFSERLFWPAFLGVALLEWTVERNKR